MRALPVSVYGSATRFKSTIYPERPDTELMSERIRLESQQTSNKLELLQHTDVEKHDVVYPHSCTICDSL